MVLSLSLNFQTIVTERKIMCQVETEGTAMNPMENKILFNVKKKKKSRKPHGFSLGY